MNERLSEQWVREQLTQAGYTPVTSGATLKPGQYEEQKSNLAQVNRLLNTASKTGRGGVGRPEFIVHLGEGSVLVIECKADPRDHASSDAQSVDPARYAVDGALHYAKALSKSFTVVAAGVSGEGDKVDFFTHVKGAEASTVLKWPGGGPVKEFLNKDTLLNCVNHDPEKRLLDQQLLRTSAAELHVFLRNYASLAESEKPLIVAGSLIALTDRYFTGAYRSMDALNPSAKTSTKIGEEWVGAIDRVFANANIPLGKTQMVVTAFRSALNNNPALLERGFRIKVKGSSSKVVDERSVLCAILDHLDEHVSDQFDLIGGFDIIGHFYGEFLKYTAGDKKGLGIVLTPPHITELFAELGEVNKDSVVLDPTAGTGGFLVAAMHKMLTDCDTQAEQDNVKQNGLIGIEKMPSMFALAASNMLLRGDGKSNMYQGSCFDASVTNAVTGRATVGMINPPYSMGRVDSALTELRFIQHMLDMLRPGSTGIAIVPMSCAIGYQEVRTEILESHTLEAVMTMPSDLFYGVGTNTVIMVFTAHRPHNPKRPSWFAQWTDDGHITNRGRKEKYPGSWDEVRDRWVDEYHARQSVPGYSVAAGVTADDEWLAAAHMETDYEALTQRNFEKVLAEYAVYKLMQEHNGADDTQGVSLSREDFLLAHIPELYRALRAGGVQMRDVFDVDGVKE